MERDVYICTSLSVNALPNKPVYYSHTRVEYIEQLTSCVYLFFNQIDRIPES